MALPCPDGRCDGSGFLYDEVKRTARGPAPAARSGSRARRPTAVQGRLPKRFREVSFDREPVPSIARRRPGRGARPSAATRARVRAARPRAAACGSRAASARARTTLAMLVSKAAMEADHTVAIYSPAGGC
jgi:DNA replication protein DnaC